MAPDTADVDDILGRYVVDLNHAVDTREFAPFVMKWFDLPDAKLNFHHETEGIENAKRLWTHLLPKGENVPREVLQFPYRVVGGRVYCWRQLQGGNAPKPLYGLQETEFDDRTLISDIVIRSVQDKPEVDTDPTAERSRLGRIFLQFAEVFNEYFMTGNSDLIVEWCSPDIRMELDSSFWGMGVIGPHNRIDQAARFTYTDWEPLDDGRICVNVSFTNWGGLDASSPWEMRITPDGKVGELDISLEM